MKVQLLRHATTIIEFAGKRILVDPVLTPADARNPFPTKGRGKGLRNPLVKLPIKQDELISLINSIDAILITHTHSDHFNGLSKKILPEGIPMFCRPKDVDILRNNDYENIQTIENSVDWNGINIIQTKCHHGGILLRNIVGDSSGYVLKADGKKTLYITGDTIWCGFVTDTIKKYRPENIIIYSGAAQLPLGRSITMNEKDIAKLCNISKESQKVIVHMEAMNHCLLKRDELRRYLTEANIIKNVFIPEDGEIVDLEG